MTLVVKGERELLRAFSKAAPEMRRRLRKALRDVARPIKDEAEELAQREISGMARSRVKWWRMRIGVTQRVVYVAPVQRGVKGRGDLPTRRPNLAGLMLDEAMEPALADNEAHTVEAFEHAIDDVTHYWEV